MFSRPMSMSMTFVSLVLHLLILKYRHIRWQVNLLDIELPSLELERERRRCRQARNNGRHAGAFQHSEQSVVRSECRAHRSWRVYRDET